MNEELSAMVDGELDEDQFARQMKILKSSEESRAAWGTCHLIGDAMRGHLGPDLCSRVAARLELEPTVLAPGYSYGNGKKIRAWAMSIAAGAAAVVLVVWTVLPNVRGDFQIAQKASPAEMPSAAPPAASQVADYLLAHQRYSSTSAMQGVAPYVRTVAVENEGGR